MAGAKHYLQLHFIVLLWGFTAILGLLIKIPAVELVLFRTLLASLGLFGLLLIRQEDFRLEKSVLIRLIGIGFVFATHWILFFGAARASNVSVTLVGMSTVTLWTAILGPLFNKQRIRRLELILGVVIIAGIYIVFKADLSYKTGLIMAIFSAMCAAIFMILNSRYTTNHNHFVIMNYEMIGACIATGLFLPIYLKYISVDGLLHLNPSALDWMYILILAIVCTVYAYSTSVKLMKTFSPYTINLVANLEPVYGIILALIIFGHSERMTLSFYLGTLIIIAAIFAYPILNKKLDQKRLII